MPGALFNDAPAGSDIPRLSVKREQIERSDSNGTRLFFYKATQGSSNAAAAKRRANQHSAAADLRRTLRAALLRLGPRQRAVIVLRYLEDHTEQEVATMLGCAPSTVSSQASRALARLKELCPELADVAPREPLSAPVGPRGTQPIPEVRS